jgi:predicted nucleotidyltransferase
MIQGRKKIKESLRAFFGNHPEVILAYLFGSYLRSKTGLFHDIDIAVFVTPGHLEEIDHVSPYGYRALLSTELAHVLRYNQVDIVILNHASPLLSRQVIGTGNLVFCRSETDRIRFEVSSLKYYADTAHLRKIKRLYMKKRIQKGLAAYA